MVSNKQSSVPAKRFAEETPKKVEVGPEMKLLVSKLSKEPRDYKSVLKAIKKSSEDKNIRKACKSWLKSSIKLFLDDSGDVTFKLE